MSPRPILARVILWRGNVPVITAVCAGLILLLFNPGWHPWQIVLAAVLAGVILAASLLLNSNHTDDVESMAAQLMRVNHRMNGEIQERVRIEKELAAARDEALELSRLKSQFLATMSHEIRTPMNGIIGMTTLLLDTRLTPEQREFAESVKGCGAALMEIIGDILDFAQIEAATLKLQRREFDPSAVLEGVLEMISSSAAAKSLKLTRELSADIPHQVFGDPARFRQMALILVGNAIKFTERGEVFVSAKVEQRTEEAVTLRVAVHDTGIGVSPEDQARIFQSFYQTDGSSTRKHGGSGLGLAICQELARLMGGQVEVESQRGKGSTFTLTARLELPAKNTEAAPQQGLLSLYEVTSEDAGQSPEPSHRIRLGDR